MSNLVILQRTFNIIAQLCWIHPTVNTKRKRVRDAVIADETGRIVISFWEEIIDQLSENKSYKVFNVSLKNFFGKKRNTNQTTKIEDSEKVLQIDWVPIRMIDFKKEENEVKNRRIHCAVQKSAQQKLTSFQLVRCIIAGRKLKYLEI